MLPRCFQMLWADSGIWSSPQNVLSRGALWRSCCCSGKVGFIRSLPPPPTLRGGWGGAACPRWCCPTLLQCVDHVTLLPPEWWSWCWVKSSLRGGLCVLLLRFDTGTKEGEGCNLSAHMHRTCTAGLCLVVLSSHLYLLSWVSLLGGWIQVRALGGSQDFALLWSTGRCSPTHLHVTRVCMIRMYMYPQMQDTCISYMTQRRPPWAFSWYSRGEVEMGGVNGWQGI